MKNDTISCNENVKLQAKRKNLTKKKQNKELRKSSNNKTTINDKCQLILKGDDIPSFLKNDVTNNSQENLFKNKCIQAILGK